MQIIISPDAPGRENFLLEVDAAMAVSQLRKMVADRLSTPAEQLNLSCEGIQLEDHATLSDFYVANLSTIRVRIVGAAPQVDAPPSNMFSSVTLSPMASNAAVAATTTGTATHAPGAVSGGGFTESPASSPVNSDSVSALLSQDEVANTIIVTGIPQSDAIATEKALFDAFSRFGIMRRVLFQDEGAPPTSQRAVLIFEEADAAAAAVAERSTVIILGSVPTEIIPADALPNSPVGPGAAVQGSGATMAPGGGRVTNAVPQAVAHFLAQGFLFGRQGIVHVRAFGDEHGVSQRIRIFVESLKMTAGSLNERYHIAATVKTTYEAAAVQAADLDRELHISEKLNAASRYALARANEWTGIAMQNPTIAATVSGARSLLGQAAASLKETFEQARAEVRAQAPQPGMPQAGAAVRVGGVYSAPTQ